MSPQERVNIAVFVDFDNIEIGVRTTLNEHFDVGAVLEALKERGEVVTKVAYADWTRAGEYSRALTQHAREPASPRAPPRPRACAAQNPEKRRWSTDGLARYYERLIVVESFT